MQDRLGWIVGALASLGLAVSCLILGRNLMPTMAEMQSKLGSVAPLIIAWGMIWRGGSIISKMGFLPTTIGLTEYLAKWAWNTLNIPVLTAITEGACEPGACLFIAQEDV